MDKKLVSGKLVLTILILVFFLPGITSAVVPVSHPSLLFHDISETPGYQYHNEQPYKTYEVQIVAAGKNVLKYDFTRPLPGAYNRVNYRGDFTLKTALAYQITKEPMYAAKVRESLLNLEIGDVTTPADRALALGDYCLAYDWIQPTLDQKNNSEIRDNLAQMADLVYLSLNNNGKELDYVDFPDFQGQAYPMMGIAGAALADYSNPNHLKLSSMPDDWHAVGTDYLFVKDKLHSYDRSMLGASFDSAGINTGGTYKSYILSSFAWWMQVYNYYYKENPFDKYPQAKLAFMSEIWESFPNGYANDRVTSGNIKWMYHKDFINLYNDTEKSWVLNFNDQLFATNVLPYSVTQSGEFPPLLYCVLQKTDSIERTYPSWTSHLDPNSMYQVFRGSWEYDADWLSLITYNFVSNVNRDTAHHDQASIEYYSRGDLLLADAGEEKYVQDANYGVYETYHNTIAIENPKKPFDIASWSGSRARGVYKGDAQSKVVTPVTIKSYLQTPWVQFMYLEEKISRVLGKDYLSTNKLSSPILYGRVVLYQNDYFIIIDRFESSESWVYDNIFRLTSQNIEPTIMTGNKISDENIGHVNGNLIIDNKKFDWLSLPFKSETNTGITTDRITWNTINPYGKNVELQLVSIPDSTIKVTKLAGRIAGYDYRAEIYSPDLWLSPPASENLYRVTALLSRYSDEEKKIAEKIPVKGNGNALSIRSSYANDTVYAGNGESEFGNFATDADIVFVRQSKDAAEITLLGGTYLKYNGAEWVTLTGPAGYVTARKSGGSALEYYIQGDNSLTGEIWGTFVYYKKDGIPNSKPGISPVRNKNANAELLTGIDNRSTSEIEPGSVIKNAAEDMIDFF